MTQSAAAAFVGSCISIRDLVSRLLLISPDQLHFPDKDAAAALFPNRPTSSAPQHDLQAILDQHQFNHHSILVAFKTVLVLMPSHTLLVSVVTGLRPFPKLLLV